MRETIWTRMLPVLVIFVFTLTITNIWMMWAVAHRVTQQDDLSVWRATAIQALKDAKATDVTNAPCDPAVDVRTSSLCAYWKAADATKQGADWTIIAFWASLAVNIGTLTGVGLTFRQTQLTLHADRAWLILASYTFPNGHFNLDQLRNENKAVHINGKFENVGRSPATEVRMDRQIKSACINDPVPIFLPNFNDDGPAVIGPNQAMRTLDGDLSVTSIEDIIRGELKFYFYCAIEYKHIYSGDRVLSQICVELRIEANDEVAKSLHERIQFVPVGTQNTVT